MSGKVFLDSNILIYAHDRGAGERHEQAKELVEHLWWNRSGVISTQVLQEFCLNVRRKAKRPLSVNETEALVRDYLTWDVVINDGEAIAGALRLEERYQISFWDSLIVHAANRAGVEKLFSEDLSHGQRYGSVVVVNPFID
jgi:predicted nucleic acid-binding protein